MGRRIVAAGAVLAVSVLVAGCSGSPRDESGQVTAAASADAFQVKIGDCTGELGTGSVTNIALIPCDQKHYWEAYSSTTLSDASYPGVTKIQEEADEVCAATYKTFVGISTNKSKYSLTYMYPTLNTWTSANDREILCLAGSKTGGLTGSLKGTKK
jgi:hypothetical protein